MFPVFLGVKSAEVVCQVGGKNAGLNPVPPLKRANSRGREVGGLRSVAVKCIDIAQNADCEGSLPAPI